MCSNCNLYTSDTSSTAPRPPRRGPYLIAVATILVELRIARDANFSVHPSPPTAAVTMVRSFFKQASETHRRAQGSRFIFEEIDDPSAMH